MNALKERSQYQTLQKKNKEKTKPFADIKRKNSKEKK